MNVMKQALSNCPYFLYTGCMLLLGQLVPDWINQQWQPVINICHMVDLTNEIYVETYV